VDGTCGSLGTQHYRQSQLLQQRLQSEGMENDAVLEETIKKLENALKRARKKEVDGEEPVEEQTYPLLDVPDEQVKSILPPEAIMDLMALSARRRTDQREKEAETDESWC
jgi:actin-related protein 5